ncbi:MAG: type IV toxin-antitoxin system AbiEi family antitoxin domain-containing protein [Kiritimatiellia bacterium]
MKATQEKRDRLYRIAESQQGYFTTRQAKESGYTENNFQYYIKSGQWMQAVRGIYRLTLFPESGNSQLVLWSLWSRNRNDIPQGVYSHETALSIYELSDIMPARLHMTVPGGFRRSAPVPPVLILHKANLAASDIEKMYGFRVTRPLRAILDLIESKSVSSDILLQALKDGLRKGVITQREITTYDDPSGNIEMVRQRAKEITA